MFERAAAHRTALRFGLAAGENKSGHYRRPGHLDVAVSLLHVGAMLGSTVREFARDPFRPFRDSDERRAALHYSAPRLDQRLAEGRQVDCL